MCFEAMPGCSTTCNPSFRQSAATWQHKGVMRQLSTARMGRLGEAQALQPHRWRCSTACWLHRARSRPCGLARNWQTLVHCSPSILCSLCTSAEANSTCKLSFPGTPADHAASRGQPEGMH